MIGIVDYGAGNLFSLGQALNRLGIRHQFVSTRDAVLSVDKLILPGVGAFGEAVQRLAECDLINAIREFAGSGRKLIGICLGMQLLLDESEEFGRHAGLSLISGRVRKIPGPTVAGDIRIPNIGWRRLTWTEHDRTFAALSDDDVFGYFVHSYFAVVDAPECLKSWIPINGEKVAAIIQRDNVLGFQFHPEKSGERGLDLLRTALDG